MAVVQDMVCHVERSETSRKCLCAGSLGATLCRDDTHLDTFCVLGQQLYYLPKNRGKKRMLLAPATIEDSLLFFSLLL